MNRYWSYDFFVLTHDVSLVNVIWVVSYLVISQRAHHHTPRHQHELLIHETPQCMLARYSFEWLGDNYRLKAERLKHVLSLIHI